MIDRKRLAAWARACALTTGLLWAVCAGAQEPVAPPGAEALRNPEWIEAGRVRFVKTCAYCHGYEGDAGKHVPFREHLDWDPAQIHDVITNGRRRGANVMPAWQGAISDDEVWRITAYILSLGGKPRASQ